MITLFYFLAALQVAIAGWCVLEDELMTIRTTYHFIGLSLPAFWSTIGVITCLP